MNGVTLVDWGAELDAGVLDVAASIPAGPTADDLTELSDRLAEIAAGIDLDRARAAVVDAPRAILAQHEAGPVLALRSYEPEEVSTIHHHAWTILVGLDGDGTVERWVEGAGGAELRAAVGLGPGRVACLGEREVHRQRTGDAGSLELVLISDWSDAKPRIDVDPAPVSQQAADLVRDWVRAYQHADAVAVGALCSDSVLLDANVPHWRFQTQGREELVEGLRMSEFGPDYRIAEHRSRPTADGAVVEIECHLTHEGEERLSRQVHLLRCDDTGAVAEVTLFCTGIWNAETIERQRLYAPMVRR